MFEIWKKVQGFDNYEVSNLGRVRNVNTGLIKKQRMTHNGYMIVDLKHSGIKSTKYVHRLVAQSFIPNQNNKPCINHKDENKTNNEINNLEWCNVSYNNSYNGRAKRVGEYHKKHHPSRKRVKNIDNGEIYVSVREAGRKTGICSMSISYCLNGKQKTAGGFRWEIIIGE